MNGAPECVNSPSDEGPFEGDQSERDEYERDIRELDQSHEDLSAIIASTASAAVRRRRAMVRMKVRWNWDNKKVAARLGVKPGAVWKAVKSEEADGEGDRALAS